MNTSQIVSNWLDLPSVGEGEMVVKTLGDDIVPSDMGIRMEGFTLDPEWVWISKSGEVVNGFLAASPCHGMTIIWRLVVRDGAPSNTPLAVLRKFVKDMKERGCKGVFAYLDPKRESEKALMHIISRSGGTIFKTPQFCAAANLEALWRW